MIHFFSNHKDTAPLVLLTGEQVTVIPHPYIEADWSMDDIRLFCKDAIQEAVTADKLIINGDYSIVSLIVSQRLQKGKKTGFIAMKKMNEPSNEKDENGNIIHRNVLKPIGIRWI